MIEVIPVAAWHARMEAQGARSIEHIAFKCVMCGTVQSIASLVRAGVDPHDAENKYIGFSCEGRWTNAGPAKRKAGADNNHKRGCDWTLGGLLRIHKIEVETPDGKRHPTFDLATPEEARLLERDQEGKRDDR